MSTPNMDNLAALRLTAVIHWEEDCYIASCPEIDLVTEGDTVEEAKAMLTEALELFFSVASATEIERRLQGEPYVIPIQLSAAPASAVKTCSQPTVQPLAVTVG